MQQMTSETFLWNQTTGMVPYHIGSHYLSKKKSPLSQTLQRRLKKKMGHPVDCNLKTRTVRQKLRITNQKKEDTTNPRQHQKMLQR